MTPRLMQLHAALSTLLDGFPGYRHRKPRLGDSEALRAMVGELASVAHDRATRAAFTAGCRLWVEMQDVGEQMEEAR